MLVCPLEGPEGVRGRECFLRVTSGHLLEVELQAARTLARLELQSLEAAEVEPEPLTESEAALEVSDGVRGPGTGAGLFAGADPDSVAVGCQALGREFPTVSRWHLEQSRGTVGGEGQLGRLG